MYPLLQLGPISIATYYVVISLGAIVSSLWFIRRAEHKGFPRVTAIDFVITVLICGFVGARLLHVFYEEPAYYSENPLRVFQFWKGGFVYLGGLVSSVLGAFAFCKIKHEPFLIWADCAALPASLAYGIGRIGCFFNGCCYGQGCSLPWAVFMNGAYRHPVQLYTSAWEFVTIGLLLFFEHRFRSAGVLFATWLTASGIGRVFMEAYRGDPRGQFIDGFSLGSWMGLGTAVLGLILILSRPRGGVHLAK